MVVVVMVGYTEDNKHLLNFFLLFLCIFPLSPPLPIPVLFCIVPRARRQLYLVPLGAVVAVAVALPAFVIRP